ncbi:MAG TPA: acyl-CoA dehydrogenase [Euryarchaeota archaeon]|nr:MAG: acyl-CoA dehydrogenase [Thermoplasmata archaeon]RLF73214.1 MAG: acyl-CoA dehydrogenase [Thermoplasmata archaeon]HDD59657.1 acyl-CoA dehydrogenase [Euryarchaeota archaeon]
MSAEMSERWDMIRSAAREFAEREIKPFARDHDERGEFPWPVMKKIAEVGYLGALIPEEYGGSGLDAVSYLIIIEEISKVCASTGVITSVHNSLVAGPIMKYGTEEQKRKYLPQLAKGERIGAFAATEPEAGSDLGALKTTAEKKGDVYVLNGQKTFITSGKDAGLIVVFAKTDPKAGHRGISAFLVESPREGLEVGNVFNKMGINANVVTELYFKDVEVPAENLLGEEGQGFKIALSSLDGGRLGIAAQSIGIAQAALQESINYSKQRQQFGQPIAKFQAIQWMIADMATRIEAARRLLYHAAEKKDRGERFTVEAAMAKMFASDTAMFAADRAVQIHGGYGYIKDYTVERLFRDARITQIYEGTNEVMRLVISGALLR